MADHGEQHPAKGFADAIVKDPNEIPAVKLIQGYPGAGSEPHKTRIYLNPYFSSYVEIDNEAILHREDLSSGSPLGGVCLWVKADADVSHSRSAASFLSGAI